MRARSCRYAAAVALVSAAAVIPAGATEYPLAPGQRAVGELVRYTVARGDLFADIARHFDIGYTELVAANPGVDPWVPSPGTVITIPSVHVLPDAPRQGIVINLGQSRLFYFPPGGDRVETFPIAIGLIGKTTPLGVTRVVNKEANPTWYPPPSIRAEQPDLPAAVPPGPEDPLGAYALHLGWKNYLIHGTNKPDSIGRSVSHGCIRLYPEDIEKLFGAVSVGTTVRTVEQAATAGRDGDALYVQVYPSKAQADQMDTARRVTPDPARGIETVVQAAAAAGDMINWTVVDRAAQARTGLAVKVASRSPGGIASADDSGEPARPEAAAAYGASLSRYDRAPSYEGPSAEYRDQASYYTSSTAYHGQAASGAGPRYYGSRSGDDGSSQPMPDAQKLYSTWYTGR